MGWPTPEDLARWMGLQPTDDTQLVTEANAAAVADATAHGVDPEFLDAGQWAAAIGLGIWWYQSRNRQSDYLAASPYATSSPSRTRMLQILMRKVVVA